MISKKSKPKTIAEYIKTAPKEAQSKLREIHAVIKAAIPDAEQGLKWGMPAFSYSRILVAFAGYKHHIGFYPTSSPLIKFAKDLTKYKTARGSIQFPLEKPLPIGLVRKIVAFRAKESLKDDVKWRS